MKINSTIYGYVLVAFFYFAIEFHSQYAPLKIPYTDTRLIIDGNLDDWSTYFEAEFEDTIDTFVSNARFDVSETFPANFDFTKIRSPKSRNKVKFRAFWNLSELCCAYIVYDSHLFAQVKSELVKPKIHLNDGIELYLDTRNEGSRKMDINDYQFLIDIHNYSEVFKGDLKEILADTVAVPKDYAQNILFHSAVKIMGSVNDDKPDTGYVIEIAIPFAAIGLESESGMKMRLDVCVNDIDYALSETEFVEEASTAMHPFSWGGYSDFGYPEFWRSVQLAGAPTWFETISEKYKSEWFWIYSFSVVVSLAAILFLTMRIRKINRLPSADEIVLSKFLNITEKENRSQNEEILKKATEYITRKSSEPIRSNNLADNLGISLRQLQRITKEELNLTPTNYICIIKLQLAADYLKNKSGNVSEAAYEFGFSDPSYFSKIFKKHFNVSPSEYIKKADK